MCYKACNIETFYLFMVYFKPIYLWNVDIKRFALPALEISSWMSNLITQKTMSSDNFPCRKINLKVSYAWSSKHKDITIQI